MHTHKKYDAFRVVYLSTRATEVLLYCPWLFDNNYIVLTLYIQLFLSKQK